MSETVTELPPWQSLRVSGPGGPGPESLNSGGPGPGRAHGAESEAWLPGSAPALTRVGGPRPRHRGHLGGGGSVHIIRVTVTSHDGLGTPAPLEDRHNGDCPGRFRCASETGRA